VSAPSPSVAAAVRVSSPWRSRSARCCRSTSCRAGEDRRLLAARDEVMRRDGTRGSDACRRAVPGGGRAPPGRGVDARRPEIVRYDSQTGPLRCGPGHGTARAGLARGASGALRAVTWMVRRTGRRWPDPRLPSPHDRARSAVEAAASDSPRNPGPLPPFVLTYTVPMRSSMLPLALLLARGRPRRAGRKRLMRVLYNDGSPTRSSWTASGCCAGPEQPGPLAGLSTSRPTPRWSPTQVTS
jgi:hypothetical protein